MISLKCCVFLVSLGVSALLTHPSFTQTEIQPPNARVGTAISSLADLKDPNVPYGGDISMTWQVSFSRILSIASFSSGARGNRTYFLLLHDYSMGNEIISSFPLPSGFLFRGDCAVYIDLISIETLSNGIVRLELNKTDIRPVTVCATADFVNIHRTRLAFFFDTKDVLTCLACEIPLEEERYTAPFATYMQKRGLVQTLEANLFDNTLIISAKTPSVSENQRIWIGTFNVSR